MVVVDDSIGSVEWTDLLTLILPRISDLKGPA
jgi:hypothetical protein